MSFTSNLHITKFSEDEADILNQYLQDFNIRYYVKNHLEESLAVLTKCKQITDKEQCLTHTLYKLKYFKTKQQLLTLLAILARKECLGNRIYVNYLKCNLEKSTNFQGAKKKLRKGINDCTEELKKFAS